MAGNGRVLEVKDALGHHVQFTLMGGSPAQLDLWALMINKASALALSCSSVPCLYTAVAHSRSGTRQRYMTSSRIYSDTGSSAQNQRAARMKYLLLAGFLLLRARPKAAVTLPA